MLVWVLEYKNGQYKLQCRHSRLSGRYQGGELNPVDAATGALIGSGIRTDPEKTGGKEVTITLPSAVAKENNCGTISSAQKAGRTTKPRGTKRKQMEVEIGGGEPTGTRKLRKRA